MPAQTRETTTFAREYQHNPVWQSGLVIAKFPLTRLPVCLVVHEITTHQVARSPMLYSSVMQTSDQILEAVGILDCSVNSQFAHKPACIDEGGEI